MQHIRYITEAEINGTVRLSLMRRGEASVSIPKRAPIKATTGETKNIELMKAATKPTREPTKVFLGLIIKGKLVKVFPAIVARPSPNAKVIIEAWVIEGEKKIDTRRMPDKP